VTPASVHLGIFYGVHINNPCSTPKTISTCILHQQAKNVKKCRLGKYDQKLNRHERFRKKKQLVTFGPSKARNLFSLSHHRHSNIENTLKWFIHRKSSLLSSQNSPLYLTFADHNLKKKDPDFGLRRTLQIFMTKCIDKIPCIRSNLNCVVLYIIGHCKGKS
jgi:hypothetical protein